MAAGPELSVAATKTFIASLAALLRLIAQWTGDEHMRRGLRPAAGSAGGSGATRLERGARAVDGRDSAGRNRPRSDARHRARGGAQIEGDLHAARRGFQRRRISPRPDRAGLERAIRF